MLTLANGIGFCTSTANVWAVVGYVVLIIKIVVPLLLILLGMIDLGKAVISSDEKAIKTSTNMLIKRFIAAVVIFFIPTIVNALFSVLDVMGDAKNDYNVCVKCVTNVTGSDCQELADKANKNIQQ